MDKLNDILKKLNTAGRLLGEAASEIAASEIECKSKDVEHIACALAEIFEVQKTFYELSPDLVPDYLKTQSLAPDMNRELGRVIIQNERSLASNEPQVAINRLQQFIAKKPPEFMVNIALGEIIKIREAFRV